MQINPCYHCIPVSVEILHRTEFHRCSHIRLQFRIIMAAVRSRCGRYIFALWFLFMAALCNRGAIIFLACDFYLSFFLFFPRLISAATDRMSSWHHRTTLTGYIFATKAHIDNRKKLVKQQYLLYMSPQYGELRPTSG